MIIEIDTHNIYLVKSNGKNKYYLKINFIYIKCKKKIYRWIRIISLKIKYIKIILKKSLFKKC
jgi:hypothetical protein